MKEHPDKHIRAAIDYALARGWIFSTAAKRALFWATDVRNSPPSGTHDEHLVNAGGAHSPCRANHPHGRSLSGTRIGSD